MWESHPLAIEPEAGARLWRYVDLARLLAMLDQNQLWFTRGDGFADTHEGTYGPANAAIRMERYPQYQEWEIGDAEVWAHEQHQKYRREVCVNCWHLNEHESLAMWAIYAPGGAGVAIRSTFARLRDSIANATDRVFIGTVNYRDTQLETIDEFNVLAPYFSKRKAYEYEHELRAITSWFGGREMPPQGIGVSADLSVLIDGIVLAPSSPPWVKEAIANTLERFGLEGSLVEHSSLDADPVF